jgi:hypothetical protein
VHVADAPVPWSGQTKQRLAWSHRLSLKQGLAWQLHIHPIKVTMSHGIPEHRYYVLFDVIKHFLADTFLLHPQHSGHEWCSGITQC